MSRLIMYFEQDHQLFAGLAPPQSAWQGERETSEGCESLDIDPEWLMLTDGMIVASDETRVPVTSDR